MQRRFALRASQAGGDVDDLASQSRTARLRVKSAGEDTGRSEQVVCDRRAQNPGGEFAANDPDGMWASGPSIRSAKTVSELSRIRDNSESLFKTLKYGPGFPERFGSLNEAREFMDAFSAWYNHEHRHTGIGLHTPADVHYGLAARKAAERRVVLDTARAAHPHRFSSTTDTPKILDLPNTAWINKPAETTDTDQEHDSVAA